MRAELSNDPPAVAAEIRAGGVRLDATWRCLDTPSMLSDDGLDLIFRNARTHKVWLDRPVPEDLLRRVYDLARLGRFFPDGRVKSNFLCNLGHGEASKLTPRGPRLSFDEACRIL